MSQVLGETLEKREETVVSFSLTSPTTGSFRPGWGGVSVGLRTSRTERPTVRLPLYYGGRWPVGEKEEGIGKSWISRPGTEGWSELGKGLCLRPRSRPSRPCVTGNGRELKRDTGLHSQLERGETVPLGSVGSTESPHPPNYSVTTTSRNFCVSRGIFDQG